MTDPLDVLITRWREDSGGTYQTWLLWDQRIENFRSIRRGLAEVVNEIETNMFGNVYKGSSLATVVGSIAEQRQMFTGADHAWLSGGGGQDVLSAADVIDYLDVVPEPVQGGACRATRDEDG